MFGNFARVDAQKNRGIEGTGLGLAITRNLCRAMGGDLTVESEYGKGSTFTATLKQQCVAYQPLGKFGESQAARQDETDAPRFTAPDFRVLVVDDVEINCLVAEGLLTPYEMQITTCFSGEAAVARLVHGEVFDLIFMDQMMPGMDGTAAAAAIRSLSGEKYKDLPIIALTANAMVGMREQFLASGFSDYLSKPIELRKLNAILERWVPAARRTAVKV
ncbi:MAG: response regulator [Planctomycetota bacterium]|nr:response regulator [Planctomycetota bacterium]